MKKIGFFTFVVLVLAALAPGQSRLAAQDGLKYWPQWRGPLANGVAPQGNPPVTWGEKQNIQWKVECPQGGSGSPIVWGDKVFLLAAVPTGKPAQPSQSAGREPAGPARPAAPGQARPETGPGAGKAPGKASGGMPPPVRPSAPYKFEVVCLDRNTGKTLWQRTAREELPHEGFRQGDGGYACYSPVTDGTNLYAYFGSRGLFCYDFDGNRKWERELGKMNIAMQFGEGGSPALHGDKVIVNRDHEGDSVVLAINKNTGETIWQAKRDERTSWSTPLVVEHNGSAQVIVSATNRVRGYDLATGKLIWECGGLTRNVIPSPVSGFELLIAMSGFRGNALQAIALGRQGDLTGSDAVKWSLSRGTPYVPSPLLYGEKLYFFSGNNAILSCYQADTGAPNFVDQRLEGLSGVYASPVGAADRVYLVSRNGKTVVIKRSKDLEILATNALEDGFDASPALVANQLFLRGKRNLYCIRQN